MSYGSGLGKKIMFIREYLFFEPNPIPAGFDINERPGIPHSIP
jgi:hypothetical protein